MSSYSATDKPDDLVLRVEACRKESDKHLGDWKEEAETCFGFVAGHQWTDEEVAYLEDQKRLPVVFNRVAPIINAIRGQEVNNRTEVRYIPRCDPSSGKDRISGVADLMTGAARYVRDNCDAEDEEADAFGDMLVCGLGWTETRMDYDDDQDGKLYIERRDPLTVRYDPSARKRNLVDRKWEQVDDWLEKDEILAKWPDADLAQIDLTPPDDRNEPHDATSAWKYEANAKGYDSKTSKYRVTRHVEIKLESYYRVIDPMTGKLVDMPDDRMKVIEAMSGQKLQKRKATRKVYKQCYVVGKEVLEESTLQHKGFPCKAMTGYRDRNENVWHGLVRYMLDPAKFANKLFSLMHHVINSNAKGGLMVEQGAVANTRKFEEEWAQASGVSTFNAGALSGGKVQAKPEAKYPVQMDNLLQFSVSSIRDSVGVPLELLGMAEKNQPGVLEAQRVRSSLTLLSVVFDSLRAYRKQQGLLQAEFIREYLTDGRLIRMSGPAGAQYIPLLRDPLTVEYDILVDEAPTSRDVKERTFAVLMALLPQAVAMGYPVPREVLDYAPIPEGLRESWKAQIALQGPSQKPSPEQIKVEGALALQNSKHDHKMQEIGATTQADLTREAAQAESERAIDADKAAHKQAEMMIQAQVQKGVATHAAQLEARLTALQATVSALEHHITASADHERAVNLAHTQARLRPKPKAPAN